MLIELDCIREEKPGEKWKATFEKTWPYYQKWYLRKGLSARPGYLTCSEHLKEYMPELWPVYQQLCRLAGNGDIASRYLSMYTPPPFMSGCTQVAWTKGEPTLIRNYDYNPDWFEGVMLYTNWLQPVIGISDCNWGLLDGMNANGLSASLTFGGRKVVGTGFGIPLVMRYVLETCNTVAEGVATLLRIPLHMAYNVTLMDRSGEYATVFLGPDRDPAVVKSPVCTNHQEKIDWPEYARVTATEEREVAAKRSMQNAELTSSDMVARFLQAPIYNARYEHSYGTLYTAVWVPGEGKVQVVWPGRELRQSFQNYREEHVAVELEKIQPEDLTAT